MDTPGVGGDETNGTNQSLVGDFDLVQQLDDLFQACSRLA